MLALENVSASYGYGKVIEGISLRVNAGEICAILGANGAGKTSILRAIMGFLPSVTGSITGPDGVRIDGLPTHQIARAGVGYVPEGRGILYSLTVRDNLLVGAMREGRAASLDARMESVLRKFPILRERLDQDAGLLSGGQQQMLAIARALMAHPSVLLLDEPSMGLAPVLVELVFQTIKDINDQGTTVLLVEQNALMALSIADRGYVLQTGRVVLADTAEALARNEMVRKAYLGES